MMLCKPRTATGRYPRGEETKQRIIDVAIDIFGRQGFAGTSTRDIAACAKVNTPAIHYYFGGKLGLYNACIDRLTDGVWRRISPAVLACQASVDAGASLDGLVASLGEVQNSLIDSFFADREGQAIRRLLAWEDAENGENTSEAFMKDRIGTPLFQTFQKVVERVAAAPMRRIDLELHALSLMGLSMIFHFNQTKVMDMLDRPALDDTLIATLKAVARQQLSYALAGLAGSGHDLPAGGSA
ncbi:CerR family C-terminal domain-containing protein [uncultured Sphingomonas sp.]|uniref:TetR/AcrR family transcriptional regulator n=1 Tax=uncultured Sphingomonas sp. TaxID=158754 RepID=UPI0035C9CFB7